MQSPEYQDVISRIRASAKTLKQAVEAVPAGTYDRQPLDGEWSVRETLIHVRNVVVMVYSVRIRRLCYETDPLFADYDEAKYRKASLERPEPVDDILQMIVTEHEQIARLLSSLPDEVWQRQGRHPELGPMTIDSLARLVADHAEEHALHVADTTDML